MGDSNKKLSKGLSDAKSESSKLRSQLAQSKANSKAMGDSNKKLSKALSDAKSESSKLLSQLAQSEANGRSMGDSNKKLSKGLSDAKSESSKLRSQLAQSKANGRSMGDFNNKLKSALAKSLEGNKKLSKDLSDAKSESSKIRSQLAQSLADNGISRAANDRLKRMLKNSEILNRSLGERNRNQQKRINNLSDSGKSLREELTFALSQLEDHKSKLDKMKNSMQNAVKQRKELLSEIKGQNAVSRTQGEKIQKLLKSLEANRRVGNNLKEQLNMRERQIRMAAKTISGARKAINKISNERQRIAKLISGNLEASGVKVDINPETGNITLKMDDSFYFNNDSYELSDSAKKKLSQVIPVYTKSLFGTKEIADRIDGISITGFASPKYKRLFVDPVLTIGEAYDYNLELSMNRARQIVTYMFGQEFPDFEFKDKLKLMTSVTGKGFMEPIPYDDENTCSAKNKVSKSNVKCECGPFDCKKSRRVEINFVLKNQKDAERHFDTISNTLKNRGYANVNR